AWAAVHLEFLAQSSLGASVFLQWGWLYLTGHRGWRLIVNYQASSATDGHARRTPPLRPVLFLELAFDMHAGAKGPQLHRAIARVASKRTNRLRLAVVLLRRNRWRATRLTLRIYRESTPGAIVFVLSGDMDQEHTDRLKEVLAHEADGHVTLDLKNVTRVDR